MSQQLVEVDTGRDEVAALAACVDDLEEQAVELAGKAIALAEEGGEETPQERWERFVADSRKERETKEEKSMMTLLVLLVVALFGSQQGE